jgi:hypothetical protein
MKRRPHRQRGFVLVVVVLAMTFTAGMLAILATFAAQRYQEIKAERVRQVNQAVLDSAARFAASRAGGWLTNPPDGPIEVDVKPLLPAGMTGHATVALLKEGGQLVCQVAAGVESGSYTASSQFDFRPR